MKTRAKKPTSKSTSHAASTSNGTHLKELEPSVAHPPQVFILPEELSSAARIATLPNPATSNPCRYLLCPERGCFEFTRVAAPKKASKSWLLAPDRRASNPDDKDCAEPSEQGYVLQSPDLMIATPVDPLFLVLPALVQDSSEGARQFYLPLSDYLETMGRDSPHLHELLRLDGSKGLERCFEARMADVCSSMDDGTETLYMLSMQKLSKILIRKTGELVKNGLPASLEDRFVKQPLATPVLNVHREEGEIKPADRSTADNAQIAESEVASSADLSQDTQTSATTAVSSTSTAATSMSGGSAISGLEDNILNLLRLRTAMNYILQCYVPVGLHAALNSALAKSDSSVNFDLLDENLARVEQLKKEALALRSLSDNISRKRSAADDDEAMEKAEAKKRKKEEEELKKKNMSRGVKQLEKADRSGMKTLSSFFGKATPKKS